MKMMKLAKRILHDSNSYWDFSPSQIREWASLKKLKMIVVDRDGIDIESTILTEGLENPDFAKQALNWYVDTDILEFCASVMDDRKFATTEQPHKHLYQQGLYHAIQLMVAIFRVNVGRGNKKELSAAIFRYYSDEKNNSAEFLNLQLEQKTK